MSENSNNENVQGHTYDPAEAAKAQKEYCKEKEVPHFAPGNGICWRCNKNIYKKYEGSTSGITVEKAGRELITGCPHCCRSYCD